MTEVTRKFEKQLSNNSNNSLEIYKNLSYFSVNSNNKSNTVITLIIFTNFLITYNVSNKVNFPIFQAVS